MLHPDKDSIQETYYDVLHVEESASYDEIRACYKTAILNSHPDKMSVKRGLEHHQEAREGFLRIHKAWEVLGNAESRALYDRELRAMGPGLVFAEEVKLKQMDLSDSGDAMELFYPCRCGDNFSITLDELEEMGVLLDGSKRLEIQEANVAPIHPIFFSFFFEEWRRYQLSSGSFGTAAGLRLQSLGTSEEHEEKWWVHS